MRKEPETGKCQGTLFSQISPILTVFTSNLEAELGRFAIHTLYPTHVNHDVCTVQVTMAIRINLNVCIILMLDIISIASAYTAIIVLFQCRSNDARRTGLILSCKTRRYCTQLLSRLPRKPQKIFNVNADCRLDSHERYKTILKMLHHVAP